MEAKDKEKLKQTSKRTANTTKKAKDTTENAGKAVVKSGRKIRRIISAIASFIGISGAQLIAIILVVVIIINVVVAAFKFLQGNSYISQVRLTDEGTQIINTFKVYTNDLYEYYSTAGSTASMTGGTGTVINDTYRLGVSWESKYHDDTNVHDDDNERDKYKNIMSKIESNEYEFVLCGVWSVILRECYLNVLSQYGDLEAKGTDWEHSNPSGDYIGSQPPSKDPHSIDAWYRGFLTHYFRYENGTYNAKYGFHVDNDDKGIMTSDSVQYNNPYFVKQAFKCCLDAFVDSKGNFITSVENLNVEISGTTAPATSATSIEKTTVSSSDASQPTTAAVLSTKLSSDISSYDYSTKLTDKIIDHLIDSANSHYLTYGIDDNRSNIESKPENYCIYSCIKAYYNHINNLSPDDYKTDKQKKSHNKKIKTLLKEKIAAESSRFLEYDSIGSGDVGGLVQLAHQQKGNSGNRYCEEMGFGLTEWCAIYAGWLLKNGGGVNLDDYGWSAGVGVWCDGLTAKGLFHKRGTYVFLFDLDNDYIYGYGHVTYKSAHSSGTTGTPGTAISGCSTVSLAVPPDSNYRSETYKLTSKQRRIIEETVSGEYGNDLTGACLIAQCCRDALVYGFVDKPENLPSKGGYDGYYAWGGAEPTQTAKDAVANVFDHGGYVIRHRVLVMYNPQMCSSSWHEARKYVCTYGPVRFFDFNEGEHF